MTLARFKNYIQYSIACPDGINGSEMASNVDTTPIQQVQKISG